MFSNWTLSVSFRMPFSLNKRLVKAVSWFKINYSKGLFLKDYKAFDRARMLCPNKRRVMGSGKVLSKTKL